METKDIVYNKEFFEKRIKDFNKDQCVEFAKICAIRALPFLGIYGNFDFWKKEDKQKQLYTIFFEIDYVYTIDEKPLRILTNTYDNHDNAYDNAYNDYINAGVDYAAYNAVNAVNSAVDTANTDVDASTDYANSYAANAAYYAVKSAYNNKITMGKLLEQDIECIKSGKKSYNADKSVYGVVWNNFINALNNCGCEYWADLYRRLFKKGFVFNKEELKHRLKQYSVKTTADKIGESMSNRINGKKMNIKFTKNENPTPTTETTSVTDNEEPVPIIKKVVFDSAEKLLREMTFGEYEHLLESEDYIFRGQDKDYPLIPTALRKGSFYETLNNLKNTLITKDKKKDLDIEYNQISFEYEIIKKFFDICDRSGLNLPNIEQLRLVINNKDDDNFLHRKDINEWISNDLLDIAGLAQHHSLPTRLLDWSYDYKVSLFFALQDAEKHNEDGVLWAIDYKYFSNKTGKLFFYRPPYSGNSNLSAQKALFSIWKTKVPGEKTNKKTNRTSLDKLIEDYLTDSGLDGSLDKPILYKFIIPAEIKEELFSKIKLDGYSEEYLFPGFDGVVKSICQDAKRKCTSKK
jgi:hypothetical protein